MMPIVATVTSTRNSKILNDSTLHLSSSYSTNSQVSTWNIYFDLIRTSALITVLTYFVYMIYLLAIGKFTDFFTNFASPSPSASSSKSQKNSGLLVIDGESVGGGFNIAMSLLIILVFIAVCFLIGMCIVICNNCISVSSALNRGSFPAGHPIRKALRDTQYICKSYGQFVNVLTWVCYYLRRKDAPVASESTTSTSNNTVNVVQDGLISTSTRNENNSDLATIDSVNIDEDDNVDELMPLYLTQLLQQIDKSSPLSLALVSLPGQAFIASRRQDDGANVPGATLSKKNVTTTYYNVQNVFEE